MAENGKPYTPPRPRTWEADFVVPIVDDGELVGHQLDREACSAVFMELDSILYRLGGAVLIAAKREEQADGTWVTTGVRVSYESWVPPVQRAPQPEAAQEAAPPPPAPEQPEPEDLPPADPAQPAAGEPAPPPADAQVSALAGTEPREEAELEPSVQ